MIKLIFYQFNYAKKILFGTVPLLLVSSIVVGTSLIGINSASKTAITAIQLFQMLIFFGGVTLFFVVSNIVQFLIDIFRDDYKLWSILGASHSHISLLISGQLFIISLITSVFGMILSFAVINKYYVFLQSLTSKHELPNLTVVFDIKTIILSVLIVPIIVGISAYFYSRKELEKEDIVEQKRLYKYVIIAVKVILWFIFIGLWVFCLNILMSDTTSKSTSDILHQTSVVLFLLLIHLVFIQMITPRVQILLLRFLSKVLPLKKYAFIIGKWNILFNPTYLKNLQASVTMGITLVSGFLLYVQNTYMGNHSDSIREATFSFITYLSAPILIILANTISITTLSSNQDEEELSQLKILGASKNNLIMIKVAEAFLHSLMIFVISSVFNSTILFSVSYGVHLLGNHMSNINGVWLPNFILSGIVCLFYLLVKLLRIKSCRNVV
ncbi:hypothetical protein CAC02_04105 [Streptococcus gallolyticus]|uniref:Uncharacterized protein n=1 Tax=Streptococcus gallolyticus TaxID=315405 RepID=A0A368UE52_9STRE|nr:FtsX-like permease family protein [Streptococcus gallolyticus]RCW17225.1 hypothetical protein CAC02_04105 [Streptococcus gallolyticus]